MQFCILNFKGLNRGNFIMRFVIRQNQQGKFWWRAVADGNGEILAASQLLGTKADCEHAIAIVKAEAAYAEPEDRTAETSVRGSV